MASTIITIYIPSFPLAKPISTLNTHFFKDFYISAYLWGNDKPSDSLDPSWLPPWCRVRPLPTSPVSGVQQPDLRTNEGSEARPKFAKHWNRDLGQWTAALLLNDYLMRQATMSTIGIVMYHRGVSIKRVLSKWAKWAPHQTNPISCLTTLMYFIFVCVLRSTDSGSLEALSTLKVCSPKTWVWFLCENGTVPGRNCAGWKKTSAWQL